MTDNPAIIMAAVATGGVVISHYYNTIKEKALLEKFEKREEPVIVIGLNPHDPSDFFTVPKDTFAPYAVFVKEEDVMKTVKYYEDLFRRSGNPRFERDENDVKMEHQVRVLFYFYQDGKELCENWQTYQQRVVADVQDKRQKVHAFYQDNNPTDYYNIVKNQDQPRVTLMERLLGRQVA